MWQKPPFAKIYVRENNSLYSIFCCPCLPLIMNKSSKISVNASSLVDLKAELFKKQEQLQKERLQSGPGSTSSSSSRSQHSESKKPSIWSKKNAGLQARAEKDLEQLGKERSELEHARNKLETKAKFYDKMTKDGFLPEADSSEKFLVDFEKKALDERSKIIDEEEQRERDGNKAQADDSPPPANPDEEWVDYVDTLGRSRRCMRRDLPRLISMDKRLNPQAVQEQEQTGSRKPEGEMALPDLMSNDMYREMLRKKWEEEEEAAAKGPLGPTHYQNIKYDEVRDMGVGYFDFAKDKTQRNEQMETLQLLRDETMDQRQRREKLKLKRKAAMQARLEKVKERKRQRGELVEEDEEEKEMEEEKHKKSEQQKKEEILPERDSKKPADSTVREWDIGKEPVSAWDQRLGNLRDERPTEFAPPSMYSHGGQHKKRDPPPPQHVGPSVSGSLWTRKSRSQEKEGEIPRASPAPVKSSDSSSDFETGHRSKLNLPAPKDLSSMYGRAKETPGMKSSSTSFSMWNQPAGSSGWTQPSGGRGVFEMGGTGEATQRTGMGCSSASLGSSNTSGVAKDDEGDAIASALSFFRKNATQ